MGHAVMSGADSQHCPASQGPLTSVLLMLRLLFEKELNFHPVYWSLFIIASPPLPHSL
jgi:hypothetical protein